MKWSDQKSNKALNSNQLKQLTIELSEANRNYAMNWTQINRNNSMIELRANAEWFLTSNNQRNENYSEQWRFIGRETLHLLVVGNRSSVSSVLHHHHMRRKSESAAEGGRSTAELRPSGEEGELRLERRRSIWWAACTGKKAGGIKLWTAAIVEGRARRRCASERDDGFSVSSDRLTTCNRYRALSSEMNYFPAGNCKFKP